MNPYADLSQRGVLPITVNESLFYTNFNTGEIIPWQGERWEYNNDYTEITIYLRDGAKWSDGEAFNADDVVFTFKMLKAAAPRVLFSGTVAEWVGEVEKVDDLTVRITLNKPGPRFALDYLAQGQVDRFVVEPEHIWKDKDVTEFNNYDREKGWPVGTGPYRLVKTGTREMWFDLRDSWWALDVGLVDEMPKVERIVIRPIPAGADATKLMINDEMDHPGIVEPSVFVAAQQQNPNIVVWNDQGPAYGSLVGCVFRLAFNNQKEVWKDREIHWALNHAINRSEINLSAFHDTQKVAIAPLSSYSRVARYVDSLNPVFDRWSVDDYDPSKTAAILEGKGYTKDDDGFWALPNGSPWPVRISMNAGDPIGPVIVEQLRKAGFDAASDVLSGSAYWRAVNTGAFDAILFPHCGSIYDPWQTLDHFHSKYSAPPNEAIHNIRAMTRYENPVLDALLDQMEGMVPSATDPTYIALVEQALEVFFQDLPEIDLLEEFHTVPFLTTYWTGWPSKGDPYVAPYLVWEGFNLAIHRLKPTSSVSE